jgi:hypothetical protein
MKLTKTFGKLAATVLLALPQAVLADVTPPAPGNQAGGLGEAASKVVNAGKIAYGPAAAGQTLEGMIGTLVQTILGLAGVLFLVLAVYGGYIWMIARGNEQEVEKAKETIKAAVIGIAVVLGAYAITAFVINRLVGATTGVVTQ